jgi:hypothetical protein
LLFNHVVQNLYFVYFVLSVTVTESNGPGIFTEEDFHLEEAPWVQWRDKGPREGQDRAHHAAQLTGYMVGPTFALKRRLVAFFSRYLHIMENSAP